MEISIFTDLMKPYFLQGAQAVPKIPPKWQNYTLEVNSTARIENLN